VFVAPVTIEPRTFRRRQLRVRPLATITVLPLPQYPSSAFGILRMIPAGKDANHSQKSIFSASWTNLGSLAALQIVVAVQEVPNRPNWLGLEMLVLSWSQSWRLKVLKKFAENFTRIFSRTGMSFIKEMFSLSYPHPRTLGNCSTLPSVNGAGWEIAAKLRY
jgi:hypothetical protein